jgi:hypothetical protein
MTDYFKEKTMKRICAFILVLIMLIPICFASNGNCASLEIINKYYGTDFTVAGGHYWGIGVEFDDLEECFYYTIMKDGNVELTLDSDERIRGICQIDSKVYIATAYGIYRYQNKKLTVLTNNITGYIHELSSNGKDMYVLCDTTYVDNDNPECCFVQGDYYKVDTEGTVTKINGRTVAVAYSYKGFAVSSDGDRMARIAYNQDGIKVRKMDGTEYEQSMKDLMDFEDGYSVDNVIYYNNCLIANVKGSLVCYGADGKRYVTLGDMVGGRVYREGYGCQKENSVPIKSGSGSEVKIGYVDVWNVGDDGYIYGRTEVEVGKMLTFRISLPKAVKETVTYKKNKSRTQYE